MMKKFLFVLMAAVAVSTGAFAQKKLSVKDITPELSVYPCQDRPEALVVVRCSEDFELEFKSNVDKELNVVRELEGSEKVYSIVFKTRGEGTSYRGRILTIMAPSFDKVYLPLELKQKEKKEYLVTDPYSSLRSIYYTSVEKANELFTQGMYDQAMDNYRIAKRCPEYETEQNNIDDYLTLCDSMKYWTALVDTAEANNDYYTARDYMLKMMQKNTQCVTLRERFHNIQQAYVTRCNADMANGELYMSDGYYEKARKVYENAVKMRNPRIGEAEAYLHEIEKLTFKKTNKTRVLNYQLLDNTPINFFRAGCKPGKTGGYFSMGFNSQCFDLLSNVNTLYPTEEPRLDYETRVSFGWTVSLFRSYAFAYFTPFSYVGGGYSFQDSTTAGDDDANSSSSLQLGFLQQDVRWYHAVAPEAGLILKYWRISLNYKIQYRYWLGYDPAVSDALGTTTHSIGVGIAW